jgi:hypothetical protein
MPVERKQRLIERRAAVDVDPEVVIGGQHRQPQQHHCAPANQQRADSALVDCAEELELVERAGAHGLDYRARYALTNWCSRSTLATSRW